MKTESFEGPCTYKYVSLAYKGRLSCIFLWSFVYVMDLGSCKEVTFD
jgi:hypothetical protein